LAVLRGYKSNAISFDNITFSHYCVHRDEGGTKMAAEKKVRLGECPSLPPIAILRQGIVFPVFVPAPPARNPSFSIKLFPFAPILHEITPSSFL
jgi:hypothetical protein